MEKKGYEFSLFNPNPVEEGLMMHLDATRARGGRGGTGINSPTIIWKDCSGHQIDGAVKHFGEPREAWQPDRLAFSGKGSDFVEVTADGRQNFANQAFTIEVWASAEPNDIKPLFAYDDRAGGIPCVQLRLTTGECQFGFNIGGIYRVISAPVPADFVASKLNQFVCTFEGGYQHLYINKVLVASGAYSGRINYQPEPVYIGASTINTKKFIGEISNVLYYKRALTAQEISRNYAAFNGDIALPAQYINVKDQAYGAQGDGTTDDTAAIQRALDAAANYEIQDGKKVVKDAVGGGNVYLPPGVYMINAQKAVEMRSNTNLYMHGKAVLKAIPNAVAYYTILAVRQVENVGIYGGAVYGDRDEHQGTQGQWAMGVSITNSHNVRVEGTRADQCWADGFYIGTGTFYEATKVPEPYTEPENIYLIDVKADRNRRQGMSLISGRKVDIIRPVLTNTSGFGDPEAGLDIEPDNCTHVLEDIYIEDAITKNNGGAGILVYLNNLLKRTETLGVDKNVSIVINGHHDIGSQYGLFVQDKGAHLDINGVKSIITGDLVIYDAVWETPKLKALQIWDHLAHPSEDGEPQVYTIEVHDPVFKNIGSNKSNLCIKSQHTGGVVGNIIVKRPFFCDDTGNTNVSPYELILYSYTKNVKICNPVYDKGYKGYVIPSWHEDFFCYCEECRKQEDK